MSDIPLGEAILSHYGVKGMHWGIKKEPRDLSRLSNDDLKKTVERMRLEQQYDSLSKNPRVSSGAKFVAKHLNQVFSTALGATVSAAVAYAIATKTPFKTK